VVLARGAPGFLLFRIPSKRLGFFSLTMASGAAVVVVEARGLGLKRPIPPIGLLDGSTGDVGADEAEGDGDGGAADDGTASAACSLVSLTVTMEFCSVAEDSTGSTTFSVVELVVDPPRRPPRRAPPGSTRRR
jgi:hypothetical protein